MVETVNSNGVQVLGLSRVSASNAGSISGVHAHCVSLYLKTPSPVLKHCSFVSSLNQLSSCGFFFHSASGILSYSICQRWAGACQKRTTCRCPSLPPCGAQRLKPGHLCSKSPDPLSHLLPKPMVFFKYLVSSYVHVRLCASGTHSCTWRPQWVRSAGVGTTSSCKPPDVVAEN